jgi:hypothetical protein
MRACYVASYSWHQRRKAAEQESEEGKERTNYDESWRLRKAAAATDKREEEEEEIYIFIWHARVPGKRDERPAILRIYGACGQGQEKKV